MKPISSFTTRHTILAVLLLSLFMITACARKAAFEKSVAVPSASGQVKVKKSSNSNYSIEVGVRDLTSPKNLVPPKQVYIVWIESDNGVFNIGQIATSRSFFSRGYKASLNTKSPSKPDKVFITAEESANTLYPGSQIVLTTPQF